jgi:hypothetical protein
VVIWGFERLSIEDESRKFRISTPSAQRLLVFTGQNGRGSNDAV